jgi:glycosyltransferase involved in cell wall biosynthesis
MNRRNMSAGYPTLAEKPHVVIFCRHLGGCGGEEHLMQAMIDALRDIRTTVFVQKSLLDTGMLPEQRSNLSVLRYKPLRLIEFLHRHENSIALFLRISSDPFKGEKAMFRYLRRTPYPKLINPAGSRVERVIDNYDYVLWECDNAGSFGMAGHPKNLVVRSPALRPLKETLSAGTPPAMPHKPFFLTVFNNYQADLKGMDGLLKIADALPCPLVWCSQRFGPDAPLHPRLIKMCVERNVVLSLMRECRAYLSLSRSEGFGWSVFEAMAFGRPVFSRPTGIAAEFRDKIIAYDTFDELAAKMSGPLPASVEYDLTAFTPEVFQQKFLSLVRRDPPRPRRLEERLRYWSCFAALQFSRISKTP